MTTASSTRSHSIAKIFSDIFSRVFMIANFTTAVEIITTLRYDTNIQVLDVTFGERAQVVLTQDVEEGQVRMLGNMFAQEVAGREVG